MSKLALYVPLEAKPGKEKEVADFLKSALPLVNAEGKVIGINSRGVAVVVCDLRHVRQ